MGAIKSQITGVSVVCSTVCSGADQRKHQRSAWLAFVRGILRWLVDSPHKGPVTRKCFHLMSLSWLCVFLSSNSGHYSTFDITAHNAIWWLTRQSDVETRMYVGTPIKCFELEILPPLHLSRYNSIAFKFWKYLSPRTLFHICLGSFWARS